jgi:hypothetical protein
MPFLFCNQAINLVKQSIHALLLATAIPFFAIVAAVAIVPRWYAARRTLSMRKTPPR